MFLFGIIFNGEVLKLRNIYDLTRKEFEDYFVSIGDKKFRSVQLYEFLYKKRINNTSEMNNIGNNIKERLNKDFSFYMIKLIVKQEDNLVKKYLFELIDGERIESVVMFHDYGISVCVSSQVGCNMSCAFCESGRLKKRRNLEAYEIVEQILLIEQDIGKRISHIVVMGIGEPFDNYDNVMRFVKIVNDNKGIDIGSRHITISTCGIVPGIYKFMNEEGQVNLAISLHAPNDEIRNKIMPISKRYKLEELMEAIKKYISVTNRRVTFEYIMLDNINDSTLCAMELSKLLKGINCYVNLIPYNETENISFKRSKNSQIMKFYDILKKNSINVTIRKEFGSKVDAACGQLRASKEV
ncbi:MAG: 23S rRNA (adenine(2503)-C(2))-methyltransferase RlmN [Bacilli bacterium]|nr:23S rRNA (adenine(2503)-C(2))-methyltransferase RlmN [Bacilli bacterium]